MHSATRGRSRSVDKDSTHLYIQPRFRGPRKVANSEDLLFKTGQICDGLRIEDLYASVNNKAMITRVTPTTEVSVEDKDQHDGGAGPAR